MNADRDHVEQYLAGVKTAVRKGNYRIDLNSRRQANRNLYRDYVIDESKCREILLSLVVDDFSAAVQNEHEGFEHEWLYIFGKDVNLLQRFGEKQETVSLYIKFNKLERQFVIVISFHEQVYPLTYAFK